MWNIKQAVTNLDETDAKTLLLQIFLRAEMSEEAQFVKEVAEMKRAVLKLTRGKCKKNHAQTVHIIFGESPAGSLKAAFRETAYEDTEDIIVLPDILSIGPVRNLHITQGMQARFLWLKTNFQDESNHYDTFMQGMIEAVHKIKEIPPHLDIVIWTCNNAHEQTGLRLVLALLKEKWNDIFILNTYTAFHELHKYPSRDDFPKNSGVLATEQLLLFYEQYDLRLIQKAKREALCEEGWSLLLEKESLIRTWEHHKLLNNTTLDRDDDFIIACAKRLHEEQEKPKFMNAARVVGEVLGHMEQYTGDEWIEYRLRCLIEQGIFEYEGNLKAMRLYKVKLKEEIREV